MLPQEESLDILIEFLLQHDYQKVQNIPIDIIRKYVDDIFFTSNDSLECIGQILDEANNFHPNIKLVRQIGRSVPFLVVLIENRKGTLTTSVYHKEAAEPYVVPFGSDHPGHVFRNNVDTAITRAVRYSTTLSEFEEEIRQMKLMFLYNGCGWGNYGYKHLDDTDYCCKTHDEHYDWLENAGCNPKWVSYDWTGRSGGEIICNDTPGTCDRRACEVDKSAVDCFESHRRTYDTEYLQLSGKEKRRLCNSPTPRNFAR
ncbi:unnamed protein product [Rotaria socialis]|uniref:Phospholipase A2-like central domain-containing protein n=1 Tax=Rotaria socialis TaxID=392032 RepID=A0A818RCT6_9BILA|nr:unnamed protein product [Rotaria socialis]